MDTKIAGDLLVEPALNDVGEYFELPLGEHIEASA